MQRNDIPHYTPEEVEAVIVDALALVDALNVPEHLQAVAFSQASALLAAKTVQIVQPQPLDLGALTRGMRAS